jgi:ribosomal protein S18 acetylase RimI-like enzyme
MNQSARAYMVRDLHEHPPLRANVTARTIDDAGMPAIASLMLQAYRGTVDYEDEDVDAATEELQATADGANGPPLRSAWLMYVDGDGQPVSAIVCTLWRGLPLIAYAFTAPAHQRQGLSTSLIESVAELLASRGQQQVSLVVTRSNPAIDLYEKLGFVETDPPRDED